MARTLRIIGFSIAALLLLIGAAGYEYQHIEWRADALRTPEAGRLENAGGPRLLLNCSGQGSPVVILESGLGDAAGEWRLVQPEIARLTRVCSYDRAGYGASDPGAMPRTSERIARELHALLQNAGERPPFVAVGHSFGGYNVRVYNGLYADEVAGMVLVDSMQEDQYALLPAAWKKLARETLDRYRSQRQWAKAFIDFGIARLMLRHRRQLTPTSYRMLQRKFIWARTSELEWIEQSAGQARNAGTLFDKPLIVLTGAKPDSYLQRTLGASDAERFRRTWIYDLQSRLARLSSRGEQIILPDSGHDIPSERPDAIVAAVRKLLSAGGGIGR